MNSIPDDATPVPTPTPILTPVPPEPDPELAQGIWRVRSALAEGASVRQACEAAGVSRSRYYRARELWPQWWERLPVTSPLCDPDQLRWVAEDVLREQIVEERDVSTAKWYLRYRHGEQYHPGRAPSPPTAPNDPNTPEHSPAAEAALRQRVAWLQAQTEAEE